MAKTSAAAPKEREDSQPGTQENHRVKTCEVTSGTPQRVTENQTLDTVEGPTPSKTKKMDGPYGRNR